jgi:hypothetical protein
MPLDVGKSLNSLFEAQVTPPFLYAQGCTLPYDKVDWQLLEPFSEKTSPD